jgi:hypothetical protein
MSPAAPRHGQLREVFDGVFFVTGEVRMKSPPLSFSRNMTVVRDGTSLTVVGSMRLGDAGLAQLDALGKVEHVIRLAAFHGMDDAFYRERYGAKVWAVQGSAYVKGVDTTTKAEDGYFQPDEWADAETALPAPGAKLHVIHTATLNEGLLLLERDGGIVVAGDSLQNWAKTDEHFTLAAKLMMKTMGFIKPYNIGPGWLRGAKPKLEDLRAILDREFEHVLPAHGAEVMGGAREKYRPAIERVCA